MPRRTNWPRLEAKARAADTRRRRAEATPTATRPDYIPGGPDPTTTYQPSPARSLR